MNNCHCPLLVLVLLLSFLVQLIHGVQSSAPSSQPRLLSNHNDTTTIYQHLNDTTTISRHLNTTTIYRVSAQLCFNCIAESLQFLFAHNLVRASKWELPLIWDSELERYARWWAGQRKADCEPEHSFPEDDFKLGENIYWGSGSEWTPGDAVAAWVAEAKYYHYDTNTCDDGQVCGHYTQIVWKSTRRIGCARIVCDSGDVFMTCNYNPPGNYIGERPY